MSLEFDPNGPSPTDAGVFGLPHGRDQAAVWILPVPFDATTSYRKGAALGPEAVRVASHQVDLYDLMTGKPYERGIFMFPSRGEIEELNLEATRKASGAARDLQAVNAIGEQVNTRVAEFTENALDANKLPVVLGGDHSVPFGAIERIAARYPGVGVLHFDAHADLREAYEGFTWSHASIMDNVLTRVPDVARIVQVGVRDLGEREAQRIERETRVHTLFDTEWARARLAGEDLRVLVRRTIDRLPECVYLSFDVDGLDPGLCPNTGTPVPGGLDWHAAMLWLEELARSGRRVVGLDLCEVSPPDSDSWDAIVGARLLYRLIGTALSRPPER